MNPLVKKLKELSSGKRKQVAFDAGLGENSLDQWFAGTQPGLINFEAALNVLGYELIVVKKGYFSSPNLEEVLTEVQYRGYSHCEQNHDFKLKK